MSDVPITLFRRKLRAHRASISPDFAAQTVLAEEPWSFVGMWLRRHGHTKARCYWDQAHHFFDSATRLPVISAPLPAYYSFLNATKCLLLVRRATFTDNHGVAGLAIGPRISLDKESITLHGGGVLAALGSYLGHAPIKQTLTLKQALFNLPYVHRAFSLTFSSAPELYVPLSTPEFVRKSGSSEAWLQGVLAPIHSTKAVLDQLPSGWERDLGKSQACVIRKKKRFAWKPKVPRSENLARLTAYHQEIRGDLQYIVGSTRLWYIKKRATASLLHVDRPPLVLAIAAMHRLSELARYAPDLLARHLDSKHNWLISEFIKLAPVQVIDELASEITGSELLRPGIDSRPR